jgi:putative transposase
VQIPPKVSISQYMGRIKGKAALRVFSVWRDLRRRPFWGNHFWAQGDCVDTVGLDQEMIRKYVKWQEKEEQKQEELRFGK